MIFQIKNKSRITEIILLTFICIFVVFAFYYVIFNYFDINSDNNDNNDKHNLEHFGRRRRKGGGVGRAISRGTRRTTSSAGRGISRTSTDAGRGISRTSDDTGATRAAEDTARAARRTSDDTGATRVGETIGRGTADTFKDDGYIEQGYTATRESDFGRGIDDTFQDDGYIEQGIVTGANETARGTTDTFEDDGYIEQGIVTGANETASGLETGYNETADWTSDAAGATADAIQDTANKFSDAVSGIFDKDKCEGKDAKLNEYKNPDVETPDANQPDDLNLTLEQESVIDYIGPGYSYAKKIKSPSKLGVRSSSSSSFSGIIDNTKAMAKYTGYLITGPALGNNFFIKSGTCNEESTDECKGKNRWLYVENIPDGTSQCLKDIGIDIPKGTMAGLVPGMMGDVGTIAYAPISIVGSLATGEPTYSNKCAPLTKKVGPAGKLKKQTKCAPVNMNDYKKCLPSF